jgi:hypothetical protein
VYARTYTVAHKHTHTVKDAQEIIKKEEEEKAEAAARLRNFIERGGRKTFPVSPSVTCTSDPFSGNV